MFDEEKEALAVANEIKHELEFARSRPVRKPEEIDMHLDMLMERVERLARVVHKLTQYED